MKSSHDNLILIGMPGAGKSTIGVILAKRTTRDFLDTDLLIQRQEGRSLQEIVNSRGYLELRRIEGRILEELEVDDHVIATGGSVIYSESGMKQLRHLGLLVYLQVSFEELRRRVTDEAQRGLARPENQNFEEMFRERCALYEKYAQLTIRCDGMTPEEISREIESRLNDG